MEHSQICSNNEHIYHRVSYMYITDKHVKPKIKILLLQVAVR